MTDRRVFQTVVLILGAALLLSLILIGVLAGMDKGVPSILENMAVGSLTGLAGLLAKGPHDTQDVNVVNPPGDPVPVDPQAGAGELRTVVLFALGGLLALFLFYFVLVPLLR